MPDIKNTENRKQDTEKEVRTFGFDEMEFRVDQSDKTRIAGYTAKYGIFTDLGWFREKIKAGAFDEALKNADVRCLKNHDPNLILGRTKNKTLSLESNSVGLKFDNVMPDTTTGKDTLEEVRTGLLSGCSFAFTVAEQEWKYFEDDKPAERTIVKIGQLFDVGPVTYPAYPDTTVAARSLESVRNQNTVVSSQNTGDSGLTPDPRPPTPELTFEQKFEYEKNKRKAERLANRLKAKQA